MKSERRGHPGKSAKAGLRRDLGSALALRLPLAPFRNRRVRVLLGPLRGARWIASAGPQGFWLGTFEHEKQISFAGHLATGDVVYDIGAHAGLYTLLASRIVADTGDVYAFEPLPQNLAYLRAHLELNRVGNATVIARAVTDRSGRARFSPGETNATGQLDPEGSFEVDTLALDEALAAGVLQPPAVLKIDVEGGETAVLVGATNVAAVSASHHLLGYAQLR